MSLKAIEEVDEFFKNDAIPDLKDRLDALAAFLPVFEAPDFQFGRMTSPPGTHAYYALSEEASRFFEMCYDMKWMKSFDWGEWIQTPEAISLRDDPSSLEEATHEQLERLLTALIRQDRFVEGLLGCAFESGLLAKIVKRASVLSELLSEEEGDGESATVSLSGPQPLFDSDDDELRERFGLPEGYSIWGSGGPDTIFCTFDVDNPGADVAYYDIVAPFTRPNGDRICLRINELFRHTQPPSVEYYIHDDGDTVEYLGSFGTKLDDAMKRSVGEILEDRGISFDFDEEPFLISIKSDRNQLAQSVQRMAEVIGAVSELARALSE